MAQFPTAFTNPEMQNAASSFLKNAAARTKKNRFVYPLQRLEESSDFLEIKVVRYIPPGITFEETDTQKYTVKLSSATKNITEGLKNKSEHPLYYIHLPIPQSLTDNNSVTWGDDTLNPLEASGLAAATQAIQEGPSSLPEIGKKLANTVYSGVVQGGAQKLVIAALSGAAVGNLGANVSTQSILGRASGQVLNPNLELLFEGVNLRTFPFVFDFAPRSKEESQEIKDIIRIFKQSMTAKTKLGSGATGIGLFLSSPDVFQLNFKTGKGNHKFLNKFKPAALVDMSLNYTASGTYSTYKDGTPVHIQMSLTFKELNPIYSEDYDDGIGKEGVGY